MYFRLPMFGFVFLGFLLICVILAVAVWAVFRSGEQGTNKLSGWAGCLVALALLLISGVGAIGCTAIALLDAPNEFIRRGPVKRIEAHWQDELEAADSTTTGAGGGGSGIRLRIEMEGGDASEITRWFRDNTDEDLSYAITTEDGPDGAITRIDVKIPITREEMEELREELEEDMPSLRLPDGVRIEIRDEDD